MMTIEIGLQLAIFSTLGAACVTFGVLMRKVEGLRELLDERTQTSAANQKEMKEGIHHVESEVVEMKLERAQLVAIYNMQHKDASERLDNHEKRIQNLEGNFARVEE